MKYVMALLFAGMLMFSACSTQNDEGSPVPLTIGEGTELLQFEPMQCEQTPWELWYEENGVENSQLSEEEIIRLYYENVHAVLDMTITNAQVYDVVCEACGVCPRGNIIEVIVYEEQAGIFMNDGWTTLAR